jgi:hypothetical protein
MDSRDSVGMSLLKCSRLAHVITMCDRQDNISAHCIFNGNYWLHLLIGRLWTRSLSIVRKLASIVIFTYTMKTIRIIYHMSYQIIEWRWQQWFSANIEQSLSKTDPNSFLNRNNHSNVASIRSSATVNTRSDVLSLFDILWHCWDRYVM